MQGQVSVTQHPGNVGSSPDPGLIGIGQATGRDFWGLSATPRSTTASRTGLPVPLMPDLMGPLGSNPGEPFSKSYLGDLPPTEALCILWALTRRPPHSAPSSRVSPAGLALLLFTQPRGTRFLRVGGTGRELHMRPSPWAGDQAPWDQSQARATGGDLRGTLWAARVHPAPKQSQGFP